MKNRLYVIILWLASSLLANAATTYYVATNGVDDAAGGRGLSWDLPYLTISNAVKKATTVNDLVLASNGTYLLSDQITVSSQITVQSWNNGAVDPTNTIVNGNAGTRCFNINHTGAVVEGFTVYNGNGSGAGGGGVYIKKGTLRNCIVVSNSAPASDGGGVYFDAYSTGMVDNCLIAYNFATNGGGIGCYYSTAAMLVTNCVIQNNQATAIVSGTGGGGVSMRYSSGGTLTDSTVSLNSAPFQGGGIWAIVGGALIIKNCLISNNFTRVSGNYAGGGGIFFHATAGLVTNCVITSNACNGAGGGIGVFENGSATIANCRIIGNRSTNTATGSHFGGGVDLQRGTMFNSVISDNSALGRGGGIVGAQGAVVRNCLISGNSASTGGGYDIRYAPGLTLLENCTIVSNTANSGGGVYFGSDSGISTNFMLNCIVFSNTAGTGPNYWRLVPAEDIISASNCCLSPALSGADINYSSDNITFDPQFVERATGNYRLDRNSPCVNTGAYRDWMINAVDLDGHRRVDKFSGIVDMGAYEYMPKGAIFFFH